MHVNSPIPLPSNSLGTSAEHHETVEVKIVEQPQSSEPPIPSSGSMATSFSPNDGLFGIEFCAVTGGLTAQLRKVGLTSSFGVDHKVKAGAKAPICCIDLTDEGGVKMAREWISHKNCVYCHYGIPCGTCSRAREIPLEGGGPRPLRSPEFPQGLPGLTKSEQSRVEAANAVYATACQLILLCHQLNKLWTLEQPTNSLFWLTAFWRTIMEQCDPYFATLHHCMYGGQRAKSTTLAGNFSSLTKLSVECDRQHPHLPWGRTAAGFATAQEVEYPLLLCKELAQVVVDALPSIPTTAVHISNPDKKARAITFKQTKKSLAFMPEFSHVDTAVFTQHPPFSTTDKLKKTILDCNNKAIPSAARILRISGPKMGGGVRARDDGYQDDAYQVAFGVPWSVEEFLEEAFRRGHPASLFESISESMKEAIRTNVNMKAAAIIAYRAEWFKKWTRRAEELSGNERRLHGEMPPQRKAILRKKRILLLKEILVSEGYPDVEVADCLAEGFPLVGLAGESDALPADFQPASLTIGDLESTSKAGNKAIVHSTKSSGDPLIDAELWCKTCEEEKKGWLEKLESLPDDGGRVSRRFAVVQGGKVRPIDNYSESQVNDAATITNKCTVDGVDTIAAMCSVFMEHLKTAKTSSCVIGRSFDLKSAYRQLAVSDESLRWARVAVYNPESKRTECFQQYTMPFGARASVVAFLRCARMLQWLGHRLGLVLSCYFDDFVLLSGRELAANSEASFKLLLDLLGWDFDKDGDKADSMSQEVTALGVTFDLTSTGNGTLRVANTEKRKREISMAIVEAITKGQMSKAEATSLKGRLGFAEGQLFGRVTRQLISDLQAFATGHSESPSLSPGLKLSLEVVRERVHEANPRIVDMRSQDVLFLFTDASFNSEDKSGGLGGVLFDSSGSVVAWCGCEVTSKVCSMLMSEIQQQAIGELETLAVLVALKLWAKALASKHLVAFVDNEGCRFLILKGCSGNSNLSKLVHEIAKEEEANCTFAWYSRVPSEANIADFPSRGKPHEMLPESKRDQLPRLEEVIDSCHRVSKRTDTVR